MGPVADNRRMPKQRTSGRGEGPEPNRLVRVEAGRYRSADERFEVSQSGDQWFVVDSGQTDELGQPLVRGPYPSLAAAREVLPEARRSTLKAVRKRR